MTLINQIKLASKALRQANKTGNNLLKNVACDLIIELGRKKQDKYGLEDIKNFTQILKEEVK